MKKFALFCAIALALSAVSVGCSADGSSSWCRSGSLWPTSRAKKDTQVVYTTSASAMGACTELSACNPCEPTCNPCEPACDPCEPLCDPCAMNGMRGVVSSGILPGPVSN